MYAEVSFCFSAYLFSEKDGLDSLRRCFYISHCGSGSRAGWLEWTGCGMVRFKRLKEADQGYGFKGCWMDLAEEREEQEDK